MYSIKMRLTAGAGPSAERRSAGDRLADKPVVLLSDAYPRHLLTNAVATQTMMKATPTMRSC
jgi:hypothetical protein